MFFIQNIYFLYIYSVGDLIVLHMYLLLIIFYTNYSGLPENHAEAFKLYKKCADMGHFTARQYMEEMNSPRGDSGEKIAHFGGTLYYSVT